MSVSIVVPAHNEEGNLRRLTQHVLSTLNGFHREIELVLVDDNSTDRTPEICDALAVAHPQVTVVHRTSDGGFGNAIKAGFEHAFGDILIPFMGDLSDDPADIPKLVAAIEDGYDVAYGSRFTSGGNVDGYPPLKLFYNRAYNNFIRLLFGIRARDVTNAFTAYRREVIEEIGVKDIVSESFDLTAELPLRAHIRGFTSTEVPVSWRSRDAGVSKLSATRKGPLYVKRLLHMFVIGNAVGLRDVFGAIASGSRLRIVGAALLGVLIVGGLFSISGFQEVFDILSRTRPEWIGLGAAVYFGSFVFRTWRFRVLLRTGGHLASRGGVFRCIMTGWFVNFLLPARAGDAARALALKTSEGVPFSVGTGMVVIERIMDMLVLGTTTVVVAVVFLQSTQTDILAAGAFGIAAVLLFGLVAVYAFDDRVASLFESRFPSIKDSIRELNSALERTAANPWAVALALLLSIPVWACEVSTIFFAARAVGADLTVVATVTTAVAAFLTQAVPVTPAGIGTYEAAITAVASVFDVPSGTATAFALVDHFARALVVYVVGAISTVHVAFRSRSYFRQRASDDTVDLSVENA